METDKDKKKDKKEKKEKKQKESKSEKPKAENALPAPTGQVNLLVIDSDEKNWYKVFENERTESGKKIVVEKSRWENMVVMAESRGDCYVTIKANTKPLPGTQEDKTRQFNPNFVLVRKLVRGLTKDEDYTNTMYGLMFTGLQSVNSFESILLSLEKPVVYNKLKQIENKLGKEQFQLIPMTYYSHYNAMLFTPEPPIVVKIGSAEAGYGKMKFDTNEMIPDFRGVMAMYKDYITAEPFIADKIHDLRIQKIGNHYRAYKRISANWKGNVGTSQIEEIVCTPRYKLWADEVAAAFPGMDILTVDAVHTKDGKEYILEINDTASGLLISREEEDMKYIKELVMERLNKLY
jgi:glutathione synthase/RimK-type ligase-like ATP-grasp enzyme